MNTTIRGSSAAHDSNTTIRRSAALEYGVIVLLSLAPLFWRTAVGADHIPAGDSWAYERIFEVFHRDHTIRLVDWNDISLVGMLPVAELWVTIFGYGRDQLHVLGSFLAAVALAGFRSLMRTLGVARRLPALVLVGTYSGFVGVAGTFQSDAFAVAGSIWAIALAMKLWNADPVISVRARAPLSATAQITVALASAAAAAYGFSVRQQAAVSGLAAMLILWSCRDRARLAWRAFAVAFPMIVVPLYFWRRGLANGGAVEFGFHPRSILAAVQWNTVSLGLLVALGVTWLVVRPAWRVGTIAANVALGSALLAAGLIIRSRAPQQRGVMTEMWDHFGTWASAPPLVALFAFSVFGWRWVLDHLRGGRHTPMASSSAALMSRVLLICLGAELLVATTSTYFSRYSLLTGMVAVAWIFMRPTTRRGFAAALAVFVCALSYGELDQTVRANEATARAGEVAECLGIPPEQLDAGFFWDGMHYRGIASSRGIYPTHDGLPETVDQTYFPEMDRVAVLVDHPLDASVSTDVFGPISSGGLLPWNRSDHWLVVLRTATTESSRDRCATMVD